MGSLIRIWDRMPPRRRTVFVAGAGAVVLASICFQLVIHGNLHRHHDRALFGVVGVPLAVTGTLLLYWAADVAGVLLAALIIFAAMAVGSVVV